MTHSPRPRLRKSMGFPVAVGFGISSLVLGTLPAYADSDREPVAQYSFTQPSGQTVTDTSGNNKDAQLVGDENWNGGYLDLAGNTHVELPDDLLAEAEAATIVVETNPQSITGAEFLWNIGGSGDDATGQMFIHPGDARLSISATNYTEENTAQSEKDFKEDEWQSIAATIEPNDDDTSTLKLWLDGELVAEENSSAANLSDLTEHTMNYLGKSAYVDDQVYQGWLAAAEIHDTALSGEDIAEIADHNAEQAAEATLRSLDLQEHNEQDLAHIEDDITLPTTGGLTWTSDPDVIDSDGRISEEAADTEVTLTAKTSVRGHEASREFDVYIESSPSQQDRAQRDLDEIKIPYADDIRANIHLPETGERQGSELTWESSDEDIISTTEVDEEAPGKVTRPADDDVEVDLTVTAQYEGAEASRTIPVTVRAAYEMPETTDYLFAHFTGTEGKPTDEQIYFATSHDAVTFEDTREDGDPALWLDEDQGDGGVRDPYLIRSGEGDRFYLIATDLNIHRRGGWGEAAATETGSTKLVVWESTDLVNWSEPRFPDVAGDIPNAGMAWAPEAFWDEETGQYYVYWATRADGNTEYGDSVDVYLSTTRDFVNFTEPIKWIDRDNSVIDTTMIQVGDWYYRASGDGEITIERSKKIDAVTAAPEAVTSGPDDEWVLVDTLNNIMDGDGDCEGGENYTGACLEGPELFKYNDADTGDVDELWGLIADQYAMGRGYVPFSTTDLNSAEASDWNKVEDVDFGDLKKRHGGILPITEAEHERIRDHYDTDAEKSVDLEVSNRCLAGNVTNVVRVTNTGDNFATIEVETPHGVKTDLEIAPESTRSFAFATRTDRVESGAVTVHLTGEDGGSQTREEFPAFQCH